MVGSIYINFGIFDFGPGDSEEEKDQVKDY